MSKFLPSTGTYTFANGHTITVSAVDWLLDVAHVSIGRNPTVHIMSWRRLRQEMAQARKLPPRKPA
jgi:hypothetical protein